jgi:hypothetical protein
VGTEVTLRHADVGRELEPGLANTDVMVADRRLDAAVLKVGMVCLIVWVAFVGHSPIGLTVRLRAAGQSVDAPAHNDQTSDD